MRLTKQTAQTKHKATPPDPGRGHTALPTQGPGLAPAAISGLSRPQRRALAAKARGVGGDPKGA